MRRSVRIWLSFALALAVMFGVMYWVSDTVLRLDRAQRRAQGQWEREEDIRLALWRMEGALTPLIVRESARPYFEYRAFYCVGRSYGEMFAALRAGEPVAPSRLLSGTPEHTLVHFQVDEAGTITSPQVPDKEMRARAVKRYTTAERIASAEQRLAELRERVRPAELLAAVPVEPQRPEALIEIANAALLGEESGGQSQSAQIASRRRRDNLYAQRFLSQNESQARVLNTLQGQFTNLDRLRSRNVQEGLIRPLWVGQTLLLLRRVRVDGRGYVQGCWLDWPALKALLLARTSDLLPHADLKPVARSKAAGEAADLLAAARDPSGYRLASLPVVVEPPGVLPSVGSGAPDSPLRWSLWTAWICLLLAAAAVTALLVGALSLGKRRAAFVSAVTHELRTPLTTFRMYAEMLAADMVPDGERRREYLQTLLVESNRLRHLVENVLTYARLEARPAREHVKAVNVDRLLSEVTPRLADRAKADDMTLVVEADQAARAARVRADPWALEMVLFNLVDNACKYACGAEDRRIHLRAEPRGGKLALSVRDHGPGVAANHAGRLFRPFRRSGARSEDAGAGVGLGLAISRRLARNMDAELAIEPVEGNGACFLLTLPLESPSTD